MMLGGLVLGVSRRGVNAEYFEVGKGRSPDRGAEYANTAILPVVPSLDDQPGYNFGGQRPFGPNDAQSVLADNDVLDHIFLLSCVIAATA
jgi:hypothetical protein